MQDYKSMCASVAIFGTVVDPKLDFCIMTLVKTTLKATFKSGLNQK